MAEGAKNMKKGIHPEYVETNVVCSCGNTFTVMSNKKELHIEACDQCHPFYKGTKDGIGASKTGRVEKFNRKYGFDKQN